MVTVNQLVRKIRKFQQFKIKKGRSRARALLGCPQRIGVCTKIMTMKPKKPNSAIRKVVKVSLSSLRKVICYIPGRGHELREFSQVLVRGGRVPDLPGVQYHLVRGKFDFFSRERDDGSERRNARSKYGIPKKLIKKFK